jgi:NADH-quinone oxidoreductase subunit M
MVAIFALNKIAISGALIQMLSHTITMSALFILVGALFMRGKSYQIADYGGLMKVMPSFTAVFLIAVLSSVALPLTAGFSGEILMLIGAFQAYPVPAAITATSAVWSVVYMLWMFQRIMLGPLDKAANQSLTDWNIGEKWALVPLIILIFAIGVCPSPILDSISRPVDNAINAAHAQSITLSYNKEAGFGSAN